MFGSFRGVGSSRLRAGSSVRPAVFERRGRLLSSVKQWFRWPSATLRGGILLFGTVVLALFWAGIGHDALSERSTAVTQAERDTTNIAIAFREYIAGTIDAIDHEMLTV